jgi:hypothetical protein
MSRNLIEILRQSREAEKMARLLESTCIICAAPKSACECHKHIEELAEAFQLTK